MTRTSWKLAAATALVLMWPPAFADELSDTQDLFKKGQYAGALKKADDFLAGHPRDGQMRFVKGMILAQMGKSNDAIAVFGKLADDYRDRPEPYNNLAVLYAAAGQYDKAALALEKAMRTSAAYSTVFDNLGSVNARLAALSYDKALQRESSPAAAKPLLALMQNMGGPAASGPAMAAVALKPAASAVAAAPAPAPAPAPVKPTPAPAPAPAPLIAAAKPAPAPVPLAPPPAAKPAPTPAPAIAAAPKPAAPVAAAPAPAPKPAPAPAPAPDQKAQEAVLAAVHAWVKAWSARDVNSYLDHYASDFEPPKGQTRKAWVDARRLRIASKSNIKVSITPPVVAIKGDTATVKFKQDYTSDRLSVKSDKTLILGLQNGKWRIKQEHAG